ncbi:MAG: methionine synthase, partial [Actinocatenispora sp.]
MTEEPRDDATGEELPWPAGAATGIGSLPGTDPGEAQRLVFGELPDLPFLPELPDRGPGAELLGRTAGLLTELPVDLYVARWRLTSRPGRDLRRTRDLLDRDLDELVAVADGYTGPLKIAAGGPWTLAAGLDLPTGGSVLRDAGALRDLCASLAEGVSRYVADVAARVPGARVILQLDEPSLPAVLAGRIRTESGLGTFPPMPTADIAEVLRAVIGAAGVPVVVHCCAPDVPIGLLRDAGAVAVAADLDLLLASGTGRTAVAALDALGESLDAGLGLFAGVVPTGAEQPEDPDDESAGTGPSADSAGPADAVRRCWHRLGLPAERLPGQVVVTQSCGLA